MDLPNMNDPESIASYLIHQDLLEQAIRNANTVFMVFVVLVFALAMFTYYRQTHRH